MPAWPTSSPHLAAPRSYFLATNADITPWVHFNSIYSEVELGVAARETSPWGEWQGYLAAAAVAGGCAFALPACYLAYVAWLRRQEADYLHNRAACARALLLIAQVLYAPVAVNTARLVNCRADGRLEVDPTHACGDASHLAVALTAGVAALALLLGTPALLAFFAARHRVYRAAATHERYLQWKEVEYMLEINDDWRLQHLDEVSSFTAAGAFTRPLALAEKFALVALNTLVRGNTELQVRHPPLLHHRAASHGDVGHAGRLCTERGLLCGVCLLHAVGGGVAPLPQPRHQRPPPSLSNLPHLRVRVWNAQGDPPAAAPLRSGPGGRGALLTRNTPGHREPLRANDRLRPHGLAHRRDSLAVRRRARVGVLHCAPLAPRGTGLARIQAHRRRQRAPGLDAGAAGKR